MAVASTEVVLLGASLLIVILLMIGLVFFATNITDQFTSLTSQLSQSLQGVVASFTSLSDFIVTSLSSFGGYLVRTFKQFVKTAGNGFLSISQFLTDQLRSILVDVNRVVLTLSSQIGRFIIEAFQSVIIGASTLLGQFTGVVTAVITKISGLIAQGIAICFSAISFAITQSMGFVSSLVTTVIGAVGIGVAAVLTGIAAGLELFADVIDFTKDNIINPALETITNAFTTVINAINSLPSQIIGTLCVGVVCLSCGLCAFCKMLNVPGFSVCLPPICIPALPCIPIPCINIPPIPILGSSCDPLCLTTISFCPGNPPVCPCPGCGIPCS